MYKSSGKRCSPMQAACFAIRQDQENGFETRFINKDIESGAVVLYTYQLHELLDGDIKHAVCGFGVFAQRDYFKGDFLLVYRGDCVDEREGVRRETLYRERGVGGCWMYEFQHRNKTYFIDATYSEGKGRMINDEHRKPNGVMKKIVTKDNDVDAVHLCVFALRDIKSGDEIRYDYGPDAEGAMPWRHVKIAVVHPDRAPSDITEVVSEVAHPDPAPAHITEVFHSVPAPVHLPEVFSKAVHPVPIAEASQAEPTHVDITKMAQFRGLLKFEDVQRIYRPCFSKCAVTINLEGSLRTGVFISPLSHSTVKSKRPTKRLRYCEYCDDDYENLKNHLKSYQHQMSVQKCDFNTLDELIHKISDWDSMSNSFCSPPDKDKPTCVTLVEYSDTDSGDQVYVSH